MIAETAGRGWRVYIACCVAGSVEVIDSNGSPGKEEGRVNHGQRTNHGQRLHDGR